MARRQIIELAIVDCKSIERKPSMGGAKGIQASICLRH
jgi:hypothetical protein